MAMYHIYHPYVWVEGSLPTTTTPTHPCQPACWCSYWYDSQPPRLCVKRMADPFAYEPARWYM